MKSVFLNAPGDISVLETDLHTSIDEIALIRVISSGICAADEYLWSGDHPWSLEYPFVPGHEIFGEIINVEKGLEREFPIGSKVAIEVIVPCGNCDSCQSGILNMCQARRHFGSTYRGAFSDFVQIPRGALMHRFPEEIDDKVGGLSETMANAIYGVKRVEIPRSSEVLILGMGSIGACLAMYLKIARNDVKVSVLTSSKPKREILEGLGIEAITRSEIISNVDRFDVVMELSGYEPNLEFGLNAIKRRGIFFQYGVFRKPVTIDLNIVGEFKELTLIGGHLADSGAFAESLLFLCRYQNDLGFLISNIVGFHDIRSAFSPREGKMFKTIFQPNFTRGQ